MVAKNRLILSCLAISLFVLLSLTNVSLPAYATTYYVDATNGNDFNNGLSPETAWKTISKVNSMDFKPGDTILFKRGEIWREQLIVPSSGTEGNPITFGAYGEGEKPIISGRDAITGWDNPDNWIYNGNNVWYMSYSTDPQRLFIDGSEVLKAGSVSSINSTERWYWENKNLYVYSTQNPASEYSSMEGNIPYYLLQIYKKDYIDIENIDIQGSRGGSLLIEGAGYINVINCNLGLYASRAVLITDYSGTASHDVVIDNCLIDSGFHFSYSAPTTRGVGDGITLSGGAQNCIIRNNTIKDWGHAGIELYALHESDIGVNNNKIYKNVITGENLSYMHGIVTDGAEGKCQNNEISYNTIRNVNNNQLNGNNNWFHHNILDTMWNSPCKLSGTGIAIDLATYGPNLVCHDNKYDNNVILNCDEKGIKLAVGYNDVVNNYFRNNILYNCGINSKEGLNNISIWIKDQSQIQNNVLENNCIYNQGVNEVIYYRGTSMTVAEFNLQNGNNWDTIDANIQADPLFIDASNGNLHLQSNSLCINKGTDVGLTEDMEGNPVDYAPDIGAYEYSESNHTEIHVYSQPSSNPTPEILANGSDSPITLRQADTLTLTISLKNNGVIDNADWWLVKETPFGLYFFTFEGWTTDWLPGYQGPLFNLDSFEVLNMPASEFPVGTYTFYFCIDTNMDNNITWDSLYCDSIVINVTE